MYIQIYIVVRANDFAASCSVFILMVLAKSNVNSILLTMILKNGINS